MSGSNTYTVRYFAAGYSGTRTVRAEDAEQAIAKVRAWVRGQMLSPMYADRYTIERQP